MKNNDLIYEDMYYKNEEEKVLKLPISSAEVNMKDKKCDYKTLAIMTLYSKRSSRESHRYIYRKDILNNKEEIENLSGLKIDTLCRNIKKLCKLPNNIIEAHNTNNEVSYSIKYKDGYNRKYVIIKRDVLETLIKCTSSNAIKVYILLKYRCGGKLTKLTRQEIASNIGLSPNSRSNLLTVTNIIQELKNLNLIKVIKEYDVIINEETQDSHTICFNCFSVNEDNENIKNKPVYFSKTHKNAISFYNDKLGYIETYKGNGNGDYISVRCPYCGGRYRINVNTIYKRIKVVCPHCHNEEKHKSNPTSINHIPSFNERKIIDYLDNEDILYYYDTPLFEDLKGLGGGLLRPDFIIPSQNLWIEYDGKQHYEWFEQMMSHDDFLKLQEHDRIKNEYAKKNGWNLVRISYYEYNNINKILNELLK